TAKMAAILEQLLPKDLITAGLVNCNTSTSTEIIKVNLASHPFPGKAGVAGVKKMLKLCNSLTEDDIVICLISGGGSALLPYPVKSVSIEDLNELTKLLVLSGVEVYEMQKIRKHISQIKGGQLAKLLQPATVISLILSDVVNPNDVTASGPTRPDESTFQDAYKVLKKYNLLDKVPPSIIAHLDKGLNHKISETPKPNDPLFKNVFNFVLANNQISLQSMSKVAQQLGYQTKVIKLPILGEMSKAVKKTESLINQYFKKVKKASALIFSTEMVINVQGKGKGGRNQHYVAQLIPFLAKIPNSVFLSLDTDGIDFSPDATGAIIDHTTYSQLKAKKLDLNKYLNQNDSFHLHKKLNNLVITGPTGTKVGDVCVFLTNKSLY
ncbi:MAG: DUF4147 domain-containing protein, partial [Candidatus Woesebacteria bacterium]